MLRHTQCSGCECGCVALYLSLQTPLGRSCRCELDIQLDLKNNMSEPAYYYSGAFKNVIYLKKCSKQIKTLILRFIETKCQVLNNIFFSSLLQYTYFPEDSLQLPGLGCPLPTISRDLSIYLISKRGRAYYSNQSGYCYSCTPGFTAVTNIQSYDSQEVSGIV